MNRSIFWKRFFRRQSGEIEFRSFKEAASKVIPEKINEVEGFRELEQAFSFYVLDIHPDTLEAVFGSRTMSRKTIQGKLALERGASLLYSLDPTGRVAVRLYPARSDLAATPEDGIYLRIGRHSKHQLLTCLDADLRDLVAYCCVSSLDVEEKFFQKLRICWLRKTRPLDVDGKFQKRVVWGIAVTTFIFVVRTVFQMLLRPLALVIVAGLLIYFGYAGLAQFLKS